ncbi:peptidase domain-containing ABC transporter [Cupriavidus oxalaticus]|uniref:Type I secretion system permease/ATPase n=2 Tax=Cupriavidus oxalaticus TaxID=96344 RepID=A0ABX7HPK1_9BURK|nr:type I secretion system permease/ATPase [Cupriavidus oxalaticus]QRQ83528.1 type I secretion system permease/ATPase [Cupriavidus oxalaticus]QRQ92383.1 type I secretion system permease/ATPase [Cupriavidus oxalaticus]WQD87000.1 type I secretion system permease/ATPase [Cupriavidus oxalaticus]
MTTAPLRPNLTMLAALATLHERRADAEALARRWDIAQDLDPDRVLWGLQDLGFTAKRVSGTLSALANAPLPVLALTTGGKLVLVGRVSDTVLVQRAGAKAIAVSAAEFAEDFAGAWVEASPSVASVTATADATSGATAPKFDVGWFWHAIGKYKAELAQVLLASFFVQIFALVTPLAFQVVIDKVLTHRSQSTLVVMLVALAGVALFEAVLSGLRHYLLTHTTQRVDVELGARLFQHLMRLPMSFFQSRRAGDIIAATRELETARNFLTGQALTAWLDLVFALVFLAVMFYYSPLLTLIVVAFLPIFFGASYIVSPLLRKKLEDKFALGADNQAFLVETVGAMETLKSQAVEASWQRRWEERLVRFAVSSFESGHTGNWTNQLTNLASKALTVILLGVGAMQVIDGNLTVGGLIAFNMLSGRVNAPIIKLSTLWQEVQQMRVAIKRLATIMDATPEPGFAADGAGRRSLQGQVSFDRVSFAYQANGAQVLSDVSFSVPAGEVIGVVGVSGAGKTTLIRLLQRLYTATSGRVFIDGIDLATVDATWLRRQIGVVSQDCALLNLSVRDNIAISNPELSLQDVMAAAELAGAHDFVNVLPQGYDTVIGERGSLLSGGQRARIAIARALATNPRLLLLDEATASLDYESERVIHDNLEKICTGRTVFIVAHRLSTLRLADRILVLDRGQLVEQGHHTELIAQPAGKYRALFEASRVLETLTVKHKAPVQPLPGGTHV